MKKTALIFMFGFLCVFSCMALLQVEHWFLQLFNHFIFQYSWLFTLLGLLFFWNKNRVFGGLCILFALIVFITIWPFEDDSNQDLTFDSKLSVLSINLLSSNTDATKVNELILRQDPDVLLLIEYTSFWKMNADVRRYQYSIVEVRDDNFGIGLFSKYPLTKEAIIDFTHSRFPMASAQIKIGTQTIDILGLHYENPVGKIQTQVQNFQIKETIAYAQNKEHFLVIGDFNLTPYTKGFTSLVEDASLVDTRRGFGLQGTWPSVWFPFRIPIDHALVSKNIQVIHREVGRSVGSDHLPLYLDITF